MAVGHNDGGRARRLFSRRLVGGAGGGGGQAERAGRQSGRVVALRPAAAAWRVGERLAGGTRCPKMPLRAF
ncbi:hypothetical protein R1flu_028600 [Riccia fluitans]|uniref:Uncharacterized protein n=1 Tax=Riccia fluitans TaxID=41844 RepID=A0ABD1XM56_9MARC